MKYYICNELDCLYRVKDGVLEYAQRNENWVVDDEDFSDVEPELVGEERVTFQGVETDLYGVYATVTQLLESKQ